MKEGLLGFLFARLGGLTRRLVRLQTAHDVRVLGAGTSIHRTVIIKSADKLVIGANCTVGEYVILDAKSESEVGISIGEYVQIKPKAYISTNGGQIFLEDYVGIGHGAWLGGRSTIRIGRNSLVAMNTVIICSNHRHDQVAVPYYDGEETLGPITIGENVWIGASCVVLPGASIGDNCVVGAGSVVKDAIPAGCVAFGVPAKIQSRLG
jgi:acetyltransferase-like isoleucine patch superfamily enzyme